MASGKSQTAQVCKFAAADVLHPLDLKCTLSVDQRQTPEEFSVLKQTFYQVPKPGFYPSPLYLSPFPARWLPLLTMDRGTQQLGGRGGSLLGQSRSTLVSLCGAWSGCLYFRLGFFS